MFKFSAVEETQQFPEQWSAADPSTSVSRVHEAAADECWTREQEDRRVLGVRPPQRADSGLLVGMLQADNRALQSGSFVLFFSFDDIDHYLCMHVLIVIVVV